MQQSKSYLSEKSTLIGLAVILLLMLCAAYSNHFTNGFIYDDTHTIVDNEYIRHIRNLPLFFTDIIYFGTNVNNQTYRPIVVSLNAIDYWLAGGLNPVYFHVDIFVTYLALLALLFLLFKNIYQQSGETKLAIKGSSLVALMAAGFYGLHAANSETINYIIQRADSVSTLFIVASLLLYINRRTRKYYLYVITIALSYITKETGVITGILFFFYILLFEENCSLSELITFRKFKKSLNAFKKSFPALFCCFIVFWIVQKHFYWDRGTIPTTEVRPNALNYYATEAVVLAHYIGNFLLPINLSISSGFTIYPSVNNPKVFFSVILLLGLIIISFVTSGKKEKRPIAFGIIWFFVALVPTSFLVKTGELSNDHRTFFPYIGLVMSLAWWLRLVYIRYQTKDKMSGTGNKKIALPLSKSKPLKARPAAIEHVAVRNKNLPKIIAACYFIILSLHAYGTFQRNIVWSSYENLWHDALLKNPNESMALMNYGLVLMDNGKYDETLNYFERVLKLNPEWAYINVNMGVLKDKMGKPQEAEEYFRNAVRYQPFYPVGYYYYAQFLLKYGRREDALAQLEAGLKVSPGDAQIIELLNSTKSNSAKGQTPESDLSLPDKMAKIAAQNPTETNYLNLSLIYHQNGMDKKCIEACEKALKLNPASATAYNNICGCYNSLGQWAKAKEACEKALQIDSTLQIAKNNLIEAQKNLK